MKCPSLVSKFRLYFEFQTISRHQQVDLLSELVIIKWGDQMSLQHVFSTNVIYYRNKAGLSQKELADRSGLHRTYISAIERERRSIALDNIEKIATALDIEARDLFETDMLQSERREGNALSSR